MCLGLTIQKYHKTPKNHEWAALFMPMARRIRIKHRIYASTNIHFEKRLSKHLLLGGTFRWALFCRFRWSVIPFLRTTHRGLDSGPRGPETQVTAKKKKHIQEPEIVDEVDSARSIRDQFWISLLGCLNASSANLPQEDMIFLPTSFIPLKNQTRSISPKRPFLVIQPWKIHGMDSSSCVVKSQTGCNQAVEPWNILNILKHVP